MTLGSRLGFFACLLCSLLCAVRAGLAGRDGRNGARRYCRIRKGRCKTNRGEGSGPWKAVKWEETEPLVEMP
jgi:hypothetical protein